MLTELALQSPVIGVTVAALVVAIIFTASRRIFIDQAKLKHVMGEMKKLKKRMKNVKRDDEKTLKALTEKSLKLNSENMKLTLKPLAISMVLLILIFPWLGRTFEGYMFRLPFGIPLLASSGTVGWLGLYIVISMPFTMVFKKLFEDE